MFLRGKRVAEAEPGEGGLQMAEAMGFDYVADFVERQVGAEWAFWAEGRFGAKCGSGSAGVVKADGFRAAVHFRPALRCHQ